MFHYIRGIITHISATFIVCENNNIGYILKTPNPFSFHTQEEVTLYTYMYIREDILDIYGFKTASEKDLFTKLISVKGIGPKGALAIIANGDINRLEQAIKDSDAKYLQKFPGIGPKASSQIILDLQGKLTLSQTIIQNPKVMDVKEALRSLGYSNQELKKLDHYIAEHIHEPIENLIKLCLKKLF